MFETEKRKMMAISQYAGKRVDYVQGGGGNTSYKFDDQIMAIKASGYSLSEVETDKGYVTMDYAGIKTDYAKLAESKAKDIEKETLDINLKNIALLSGMENRRPSVEVGFHSYLKRAVVHTHSVYANVLCCAEEGKALAETIFESSDLDYIYIPFINPGFTLSRVIKEKTEAFAQANGKTPELIFMENHGIIASDDDADRAMAIHEQANQMLIDYFKLNPFPESRIKQDGDGFVSQTRIIKDYVKANVKDAQYFDEVILYPDQMVYLGSNLGKTIHLDTESGAFTYLMGAKQAQVIDEVILGVIYIISEIARCGLTLRLLSDEGIDFIRNWESEKYRAKLAK